MYTLGIPIQQYTPYDGRILLKSAMQAKDLRARQLPAMLKMDR